ncbi:15753_t:CDS:2, partial [Gigaspora rosea]
SISSKFSENTSTDDSDTSVKTQQNWQSPTNHKHTLTFLLSSLDSESETQELPSYPEIQEVSILSQPEEPKVTMEQKMMRIPKNELIYSLFGVVENLHIWHSRALKIMKATGGGNNCEVLNEIEILDKKLLRVLGTPGKLGSEEDYSYEALSLPLQKNRSSQLESSDMSEDTVRTSEPPLPGTSIPYGPYKICG